MAFSTQNLARLTQPAITKFVQAGILREIYFRAQKRETVLMLECADAHEARQVLQTLPLVQAGQIAYDLIPLVPYDRFSRLAA